MDATGGERLLGRTELSPLEVLVRETAQNSWDARLEGNRPTFGINLRRADFRMREELDVLLSQRHRISPVAPDSHGTHFLLEIFDRGTSGLDGPVTLQAVRGESPRNFQDLILKVGVPRDDGKGGGTYGFGKTASYAFSARGTVVYWSRCRNERGLLEHRLIASAFRDSYTEAGVQFTGRHWWGRRDGDIMLPLIGDEAESLGERIFERSFERDETGTSILIVEPLLSREALGFDAGAEDLDQNSATETAAVFAANTRSALRQHLWPKMIPEPGADRSPMDVILVVDDATIPLVDDVPGALELWGAGLNAIRASRMKIMSPVRTPQGLPVIVTPITRYRQVLGHLAIVRRVPALEVAHEHDDLDPLDEPRQSRVVLMRGQPELVVATVDWVTQSPLLGFDWLAVYKSADEWDSTYARTEPPAHDAWIASSGGEEGLVVKATRTRIVAALREELYPEPTPAETSVEPVRTGALSRRFGFLIPTATLSPNPVGPNSGNRRRRVGGRGDAPRVEIGLPSLLATYADGSQRQSLDFTVIGGSRSNRALVTIDVSAVGDEGIHEPIAPADLDLEWTGAEAFGVGQALVVTEQIATVRFTGLARRALRIDLNVMREPQEGLGTEDARS